MVKSERNLSKVTKYGKIVQKTNYGYSNYKKKLSIIMAVQNYLQIIHE